MLNNILSGWYFQRATFLEEDEEMENAHSVAVAAGDTEVIMTCA